MYNRKKEQEPQRLIGLEALNNVISEILGKQDAYRRGAVLPHLILPIESGNGQSYITEYMANLFQEYELRNFGGKELYLEYKLDGTLEQIYNVFSDIADNAVYTNAYEGVVTFDVNVLIENGLTFSDKTMQVFLAELKKLMESSTVLLFVSATDKRTEIFCKKLMKECKIKLVDTEPYSTGDLFDITVQHLKELGIKMENSVEQNIFILDMIRKDVASAKDAIYLGDKLAMTADYTKKPPLLKCKNILQILEEEKETIKVKEEIYGQRKMAY